MASQLYVVDAQMRRALVKVTPSKPLSDVLAEACGKLGHKPEQYTLKHNNKQIDLSRTIRLSGLQNMAKLELVQASRSPSVISVALQLPAVGGASSTRLTDKFPSDTPIWQILRRFEAGAAGGASTISANYNFTQRATPQMASGASSGSGRLCYEMPVVNVLNRDLSSFIDLQKTLGQLGLNGGTCLLRLSYKNTEQPLEDAMTEITEYFKENEQPEGIAASTIQEADGGAPPETSRPDVDSTIEPEMEDGARSLPVEDADTEMQTEPTPGSDYMASKESESSSNAARTARAALEAMSESDEPPTKSPRLDPAPPTSSLSKMEIYTPSTSATPRAANAPHDADDYTLSIAQAQRYQDHLNRASRNKRLPSDKEIADTEKARADALAAVASIKVALRLPDTSRVTQGYDRSATTKDLYAAARNVLNRPKGEAFVLLEPGQKRTLIKESDKRLIADLGWTGSVLVTVEWVNPGEHEGAVLKEEYAKLAKEIDVKDVEATEVVDEKGPSTGEAKEQKKKKGDEADREARMKKLMGKMGFKK